MGLIFIFFGRNATGKSVLVKNVQEKFRLNAVHTRRLVAELDKSKTEKELLAGFEKQSQTAYLDAVKGQIVAKRKRDGLIIEGPFSLAEVRKIQSFFPQDQIVLVELDSTSQLRLKRLMARHNLAPKEAYQHMQKSDGIRTKRGITSLEQNPNVVVTNNAGLDELYRQFHEKVLFHQRERLLTVLKNRTRKLSISSNKHNTAHKK